MITSCPVQCGCNPSCLGLLPSRVLRSHPSVSPTSPIPGWVQPKMCAPISPISFPGSTRTKTVSLSPPVPAQQGPPSSHVPLVHRVLHLTLVSECRSGFPLSRRTYICLSPPDGGYVDSVSPQILSLSQLYSTREAMC